MNKVFWLLPFLLFYILVCVSYTGEPVNDQIGYIQQARNLTEGYFVESDIRLWHAPGYPLVLAPFVWADALIWARYLNSLLLFGAVCFVYFTLCEYTSQNQSLLGAYFLGLYLPFLQELPKFLTEPLAIFLVAGFAFFAIQHFRRGRFGYLAAFFLGYLLFTKPMFAYATVVCLAVSLLLYRRAVWIYALALLLCTPYLAYTHSLTGKFFYWSTNGGAALYWMSTPYDGEWGDWKSETRVSEDKQLNEHKELYDELAEFSFIERDELYKRAAISNIRRYPLKYCYNWIANVARIWLSFPQSYRYQTPHTLLYMVFNSVLWVSLLLCAYPLIRYRKDVPVEIVLLIVFALAFLFGSSLVSALARYLKPMVSVFIIVIFYTATTLLQIRPVGNDLKGLQ